MYFYKFTFLFQLNRVFEKKWNSTISGFFFNMTSIRQTFYILRGNHCLSSNVIYLRSVSTLEVCIQSQIYRIFRYVWHVLLKNSIVRKILKYTYTVVWTHHDRFGLFSCCTYLSCRSMSTEFKSCTTPLPWHTNNTQFLFMGTFFLSKEHFWGQ